MQNFQWVETSIFRRDDKHPNQHRQEVRPHIIGLNDAARRFIIASRTNKNFRGIFGPFYIGGQGSTIVNDVWEPSLRFKNGNSPAELNAAVMEVESIFAEKQVA